MSAEFRIGRRRALQGGIAASAAAFVARPAASQVVIPPPSPPTTPWVEELPVQRPIKPVSGLSPSPAVSRVQGECGRADHQGFTRFPPQDLYEVRVREGSHSFHRELPTQTIWGYDGTIPGPLFHARYGRPILVRFRNELPRYATGAGSPEISVHLHNLHTPSESDGFPVDFFSSYDCGPTLSYPGEFKDHHYPMVCAGLDTYGGSYGDSREALGTMWYHDHRLDFTASNVYRGMAGFFLAFDTLDSGDEHDPNPEALRLPSGDFDIPLLLADKRFDSGGYLLFDQFDTEGFVGDKFTVNGKIQPFYRVQRRKYRFRILDGGPSRFYDLQLRRNNLVQSFTYIANDGNLLPAPLTRSSIRLGVAERADIVVDFSRYQVGDELLLTNRLRQLDGRKPEKDFGPPVPLLKFIVDREPDDPDESRVPGALRELPDMEPAVITRRFNFDRSGGVWTVNDRIFDNRPRASPKKGTAEIWVLRNLSGGWAHPVHIHFEHFRILSRNGAAPPAHERGRKDTVVLGPEETVRVFMRFRDFTGRYVMHCHNLIHEDHAMMVRYDIVP